jgi:kinetochore protein Mis13/DSN1
MGPPSDVFTRKTRKSMGAAMLPPPVAESSTSQAASIGNGLPRGVLPTDVAVPLPESETPMIRKNKALREDQSRRSSLGMRGQRASTSLGRGELSALRL